MSSQQLLTAAKAGDVAFWASCSRLSCAYLKRVAEARLRGKLKVRFSGSDVVQDTFLAAHRGFREFRGQSENEFKGWLRQILVYHLSRLVEQHVIAGKRDVRREISLQELGAFARSTSRRQAAIPACAASPSQEACRHENTRILAAQMEKLPADYRDVLVLRHLEGLPFADVAKRMGRSPGAVRMLWLRALELLRKMMAEKEVL